MFAMLFYLYSIQLLCSTLIVTAMWHDNNMPNEFFQKHYYLFLQTQTSQDVKRE